MPQVVWQSLQQVGQTLLHNWPFLLAGILIAAAMRLFVSPEKISALFRKRRVGAVVLATGAAVATPLCSCGTMAVILGMLASAVPWAPVVAFMVASPLTSPEELLLSAGIFGWPFALVFFAASIALGLAGGAAAHLLEARGWLAGQARLAGSAPPAQAPGQPRPYGRALLAAFGREAWSGTRKLVPLFLVFAFAGYLLNNLIPARWIGAAFARGSWGVPLAATLGLPLYVNTEASLPLVRAFIDNGASAGSALAFLITGAGTSLGAVAGAFAIARWRIIGLVVATLWVGALVAGYTYDALGGTVAGAHAPKDETTPIDRDLVVLTDPKTAGRLSGTPGAKRASEYLAGALHEAGLEPAGAKGYFQPVDVPAARLTAPATLKVGGRALAHRVDFAEVAPISRGGSLDAPLEVVDTEQVAPDALHGRVALIPSAPEGMDLAGTAAAVADAGARALLVGTAADGPFGKTVQAGAARIPVIRVREEVARELATRRGEPVALELPLESGPRPCRNVVGILRGTGKGPAVLIAAHYDHVGDDPGGLRFAGAFDNASGVAAVLEAARRLAGGPRLPFDVVVALTTGEESGLWGMRQLAAHPPAAIGAGITLDGIGAGPKLAALRIGQSAPGDAFGALAAEVVRESGIEPLWIDGGDDSAALRAAHIPAVGLGQQPTGSARLPLHTTGDDLASLDRDQISVAAGVLVSIVQRLAAKGLPAAAPAAASSGASCGVHAGGCGGGCGHPGGTGSSC